MPTNGVTTVVIPGDNVLAELADGRVMSNTLTKAKSSAIAGERGALRSWAPSSIPRQRTGVSMMLAFGLAVRAASVERRPD